MLDSSEILSIKNTILELDEDDLRINIISPLLKALGCTNVSDRQGPAEAGIDVYFEYKSIPFGEYKHCGVVLKNGILKPEGANIINRISSTIHLKVCIIMIDQLVTLIADSLTTITFPVESIFSIEKYKEACEGHVAQKTAKKSSAKKEKDAPISLTSEGSIIPQ